MNGDPYRTPQPADRRVINRSGQAYPRAEEPRVAREEASSPEPVAPPPSRLGVSRKDTFETPKKRSSKSGWVIATIVLCIALLVAGWFALSNNKNTTSGIDSSRYQAVFLSNGLIYFGKLQDFNDASFKMTTVYYPQAQKADAEETEAASQSSSDVQLIRLGDEVYGPENEVYISKENILHYENLKADSKVADLIKKNEAR